jgi:mRNA-degrading endonuclease RelE of RelBE toxin-antitoxin system
VELTMSIRQTIDELIKVLPPELQREVEDFARFLIERRQQKRGEKLRQNWAGALGDYRVKYTSLELEKKALEWRGD